MNQHLVRILDTNKVSDVLNIDMEYIDKKVSCPRGFNWTSGDCYTLKIT